MKKKLLSLSIISVLLTGCFESNDSVSFPQREPSIPETPETPDGPATSTSYLGTLLSSGKRIAGDVYCYDQLVDNGSFEVPENTEFSCFFGSVELGRFASPAGEVSRNAIANDTISASFDLSSTHGENATKVLQSISTCPTEASKICLKEIDAFDITAVYSDLSDEAVENFLHSKEENATDEVGKAPSSHVDNSLVPEVDPDANDNLNSAFVSADAEASYAYQASSEAKVLTKAQLTDDNNKPLAGISFFSANATGVTNANGEFEYLWGDSLVFGIDTFEFGKVAGNQLSFKLSDVSNNVVTKANIQALVERYAEDSGNALTITPKIQQTFALYPNVINDLINLALPNGGTLEGTDFSLPNEFEQQFNQGLTANIDATLRQSSRSYSYQRIPKIAAPQSHTYVTDSLQSIFANVDTFHVFNDNGPYYGATGYTRGMRALNLSNRAFPLMMPRTDNNRELFFDQPQAWDRNLKPYVAQWPGIEMPPVPLVNEDNATYGFPFVTAGEIGAGKVVFMGNGMYPSILSCPDNYWANGQLRIDSGNKSCSSAVIENALHDDKGSMKQFFTNLFTWFNQGKSAQGLRIATNIELAYAAKSNTLMGQEYEFFVHPSYGFSDVVQLSKGSFSSLSPSDTPILLLQAFPPMAIKGGQTNQFVADLDNPNLSQEDITALIQYLNQGGNILFMDALQTLNPDPVGRLADAAGVSVGGENMTPTNQAFCGSSYFCGTPTPNLHVKGQQEMVVLERFQDNQGEQPFTVNPDGSVDWIEDETKIEFEIPSYQAVKLDKDGKPELDASGAPIMETKYARIFVKDAQERQAAIKELQAAFENTPLCTHEYEWEFNCIETRSGHGKTARGAFHRPDFDRYQVSPRVIKSMVKSANLGSNVTALYNHEIYYRSKGKEGIRLSANELNQTYDNLATWLWNDNPYRFEGSLQDELGFEQAVQFLNCYTNNQHQNDDEKALCPETLKASLIEKGMLYDEGELNPSYPLNYMEKPLTRIMLGRSFWDQNIRVDTRQYPGRSSGNSTSATARIHTDGTGVSFSAGNRQATGLWAPQLEEVTITQGVKATITVMLADDLTGRANHEKNLRRPPRMQKSFDYDGSRLSFKTPYGGLIYIQPLEQGQGEVSFSLQGVEKAAFWKEGKWIYTANEASAPIAEVDTGSFVYTTPIENIRSIDLNKFADDMNRFADAASDFYGRDETTEEGLHRRFTYAELKGFRHHFVNDVQITIGSAHSGYPVMNSSFRPTAATVPTNALNDWLLWHEVGHNLAAAPFKAEGSTEVTNNLLALYMQELEGRNDNPRMDRLLFEIQKAPLWLKNNAGHAWANGDAGLRLIMFGQLKVWAKNVFRIDSWYQGASKPEIYGPDEGWNLFKLMHRKTRGDSIGDKSINHCSPEQTGLSDGDLMMLCSSYVTGFDLSEFFTKWNLGEVSVTNADGSKVYTGGISDQALTKVKALGLPKPTSNPLSIDSID